MHAVQLVGHGGLEKLCYRDDVKMPRMGNDDVLIRVRAASVNSTDINTRIGWHSKSISTYTNAGSREVLKSTLSEDASWSGVPLVFPRILGADVYDHIVDEGRNISR